MLKLSQIGMPYHFECLKAILMVMCTKSFWAASSMLSTWTWRSLAATAGNQHELPPSERVVGKGSCRSFIVACYLTSAGIFRFARIKCIGREQVCSLWAFVLITVSFQELFTMCTCHGVRKNLARIKKK